MSYIPNVVQRWDKGHWDVATWDGQVGVSPPATTFALAGQSANLLIGHALTASVGSVLLTGNAATLTAARSYPLVTVTGTFTLTGYDAGTLANRWLTATVGNFALTGSAAGSISTTVMAAAPGAFALTGFPASLSKTGALSLAATSGAFTLTGQDAGLTATRVYALAVGPGAFALTGQSVNFIYAATTAYTLTALSGAFVLSGKPATLLANYIPPPIPEPPLPGVLNFGRKVILIPGRW